MDIALQTKLEQAREQLKTFEKVAVAFSGGVDSALVTKLAHDVLGDNSIAFTGISEVYAKKDVDAAKQITGQIGVRHELFNSNELSIKAYRENPANRCYHCKSNLYDRIGELADEMGIQTIANGTNVEDLGDYRPGIQAGKERNVISPLVDAQITKAEIRTATLAFGLPVWNKPANPCLSSRVQYNTLITPEKLKMIEDCEAYLVRLGFDTCRVRHHETIARIEIPGKDFPEFIKHTGAITTFFKQQGFVYVSLDLGGFSSGSMNKVLFSHPSQG